MTDDATIRAWMEVFGAATMLVTAITALIVAIRQHKDVQVNRTILRKVESVEHILDPDGSAGPSGSKPPSARSDGSARDSSGKRD